MFLCCSLASTLIASSSNFVRSNRPSSPVGFSGAKNCCGRSQDAASSVSLPTLLLYGVAFMFVGVQSIPSSLSSCETGVGMFEGESRDGSPNTGLDEVMTGLLERERDARRSGSLLERKDGVPARVPGLGVAGRELGT